ncbi:MAG TPA: hypothetical protein VMR28_03235 [Candidatus Saccharimonadales bacterium]|nr:hypothetical protein [Candidatus Saccharimonadales bacterium]
MENKNESVNNNPATEGFTRYPNSVVDFALLGELKPLESRLLLLVVRLTFGCHREWVELIQADLIAADIAANRAKDVIASALSKGVLVRDGKSNRYQVGSRFLIHNERGQSRLDQLIHRQLSGSSEKRNIYVPKTGTSILPKEEDDSYENSNSVVFLKQEHLRVVRRKSTRPKDRLKKVYKETVKETNARKTTISPYDYKPHSPSQRAALAVWRYLEPDKPENFGLYVGFVKRGLPERIFYELAMAINDDNTVKNKGAYFNKKATEYCRRRSKEVEVMNG